MTVAPRSIGRLAAAAVLSSTAALTAAFTTAPGAASAVAGPAVGARFGLLTQETPHAGASSLSSLPGPRRIAGTSEQLLDVSATSARNAWATGQRLTTPTTQVLLHWNGTTWSHAAIPHSTVNTVDDISALSAGNAWMVGSHCASGCTTGTPTQTTLIMHWNGTAWSRVPSPSVAGRANFLFAVSASSADNAWAAGNACSTTVQSCAPLMLHWNGTKWSKVTSPAPGLDDTVYAVTTISATDAWAVGHDCISSCYTPLVLHWNGTRWSAVAIPFAGPGGLFGVTATSASDVWAVGNAQGSFRTLIFHWNGTRWSRLAHPDPGAGGGLFGVTATSRSNAWAAGVSCTTNGCGSSRTLTLHWNGTTWSHVPSPSPGTGSNLSDVAATSPSNAWAVGENCSTAASPCKPMILHWNGTTWMKA